MSHIFLIDSGHGGIINGEYQTAPNKMFTHAGGETFYEGVFNRTIKNMLLDRLKDAGIPYVDICPTELDLSLRERVEVANVYHSVRKGCILLSLHSNASKTGKGTGFEVYAYEGSKQSQRLGNLLGEQLSYDFPDIRFRKNDNGDFCKTAQFYILKYTFCKAVLVECLFFDNWNDYQLLINPDFQIKYVHSLLQFIMKVNILKS